MAEPINVRQFGNGLLIQMDDATTRTAYELPNGMWVVSGSVDPTPPPPPPGGRFIWPFSLDLVTSEYGERDGRLHAGIDFGMGIANVPNTPVIASSSGVVVIANTTNSHGGYGNAVVLDHGEGLHTLYAHLEHGSVVVWEGQVVEQGQILGGIGNTGASQGYHLHFETHEGGYNWNASSRDPRVFIPKWNAM